LNQLRDEARIIANTLGLEKAFGDLNRTVGLLLNTHKQGGLRTRNGQLVAQGTPVFPTLLKAPISQLKKRKGLFFAMLFFHHVQRIRMTFLACLIKQ
jgi:hypothetical protein